jgi:tetratricopeptide (TPR) repeat protein
VLTAGCSPATEQTPALPDSEALVVAPPSGRSLLAVTLPARSSIEGPVREQLSQRHVALVSAVRNPGATDQTLAAAYGDLGKLLQAATHFDAAEACYLNAQTLAPGDGRWPYLLAQIYRVKGPLDQAVSAFEQTLRIDPSNVPALVWLGEVHLTAGRTEAAEPLFAKALGLQARSAAARYGLGRTALARREFARAVTELTETLALEPGATAAHYPLAMAYRGLGETTRAQAELERQGDIEPRPDDPLMRELDGLLQSPESYNVRGGRELEAGNWAAAADWFEKGLALAPRDVSLRHRLGTALAQMGDTAGAIREFEHVVRTDPTHARAHFSLGLLLAGRGRHAEAVDRLTSAARHEPGYLPAHVQLALALAQSGRPADALPHFEQALAIDPTHADTALAYALTLIRLERYREARDRLAEGVKIYTAQPLFGNALARILAASPDDRVRDGRRAKAIADNLYREHQSFEVGETIAMVLAELGDFRQAAAVQRDVMAAAEKGGAGAILPRLRGNLDRYEKGLPCRTPFGADELP